MDILNWLLGGGGLIVVATVVKQWHDRRELKAQAKIRDLKTPAEVDNLVATVHRANLDAVLLVNTELRNDNNELRARLEKVETKQTEMEATQEDQGREMGTLQRGLASAYAYITTLLRIIEEHLPHIIIPPPPKGYKDAEADQLKGTA